MRTHAQNSDGRSPLDILTELALEGTSSLVEAQRTFLSLAEQENEIILNGMKERMGSFVPAVAATDLVRRSLDTLISMQQELLTATSKQSLRLLESATAGKTDSAARLVEFAREGAEAFARAQQNFIDALGEEAARAANPKVEHERKPANKTHDVTHLAREASNAFIEAQKRLLDILGQQMNVTLDAATRTSELLSPSRLMPIADLAGEQVRRFLHNETELIGSLIKPRKKTAAREGRKRVRGKRQPAVPA